MRLLRLKQIVGTPQNPGILPISASSWWAGVKIGKFPQPVKLGPRTTAWRESDIEVLKDGVMMAGLASSCGSGGFSAERKKSDHVQTKSKIST